MNGLKPIKIKPLIIGLLFLLFLLAVNCDDESEREKTPSSLEKVNLIARSISPDIKTSIESGKAHVRLRITTDKSGTKPAQYYTSVTPDDTKNYLDGNKKSDFPIGKDGSIKPLFLKTYSPDNTRKRVKNSQPPPYYIQYYIQQFDFYKSSGSSSDKPDYIIASVQPFTLKINGDNQVKLYIIQNKTKIKTEGSTILPLSLKVGFKKISYAYFTSSSTIDIDLTLSYTTSSDKQKHTIIDQKNVLNSGQFKDNYLVIPLDNKDYDYLYKDGTFTVAASINNYPSKKVKHDFVIPKDLDKQIRSGTLVLKVSNNLPSITAKTKPLEVSLYDSEKYDVKNQAGITAQDLDNDKLFIHYTYEILYRSTRAESGTKPSTNPFDKKMPKTLHTLCPDCVTSDSQGNTSINLYNLRQFFNKMLARYYPYPYVGISAIRHPVWVALHPYVTWIILRNSDFALRLFVETNDDLEWTERKELLNIYFN